MHLVLMQHSAAYEILKDFQPTLAAIIALTAAWIAYTGVMAKVRFDQRVADREFTRRKVAMFVRLRYEVAIIVGLAGSMHERAAGIYAELKGFKGDAGAIKAMLESRPFEPFLKAPAIDEAWRDLHLFPLPVADDFDRFRRRLIVFRHFLETAVRTNKQQQFEDILSDIHRFGSELNEKLDSLIDAVSKSADISA